MRVGDLCAKPLRPLAAQASLVEAAQVFERFGGETLLVLSQKEPLGLLFRDTVAKAQKFGLPFTAGDLAYPDLPLLEAEEEAEPERLGLILRNPARRALIRGKDWWGVLAAEDLLFSGLLTPRHPPLKEEIPHDLRDLLAWFYALSRAWGIEIYLVGGAVRDLLLERSFSDLDLVASSRLEELGTALEETFGAQRCKRSLFMTFKFRFKGYELDLALARWEEYEAPAALPRIVPGSLFEDLFRRDFTVNALALSLSGPFFGRLIDLLGGTIDLMRGHLRVHHVLSFIDDPTRIFRAARYATRFSWSLSPGSQKALRLALKARVLFRLSPARMRQEWQRLLAEAKPLKALAWLADQGILRHLFPETPFSFEDLKRLFSLIENLPPEERLEALALYLCPREEEIQRFFGLEGRRLKQLLASLRELTPREEFLRSPRPLSEKIFFLEKFPRAALAALGARKEKLYPLLETALKELFFVRPALSGRDLQKAGVPPGPKLGEMLKRLRAARLDGLVKSKTDEWIFLEKEFPDVFSS